jgi:hypothetical protein
MAMAPQPSIGARILLKSPSTNRQRYAGFNDSAATRSGKDSGKASLDRGGPVFGA